MVLDHIDLDVAEGTIFEGVIAYQGNLKGSALRGSTFTGADLTGSSFRGSDVREANFDGANLTDCDLSALKGMEADESKVTVLS